MPGARDAGPAVVALGGNKEFSPMQQATCRTTAPAINLAEHPGHAIIGLLAPIRNAVAPLAALGRAGRDTGLELDAETCEALSSTIGHVNDLGVSLSDYVVAYAATAATRRAGDA
jgi:hypothetical protein